jgi:hypothetical protein
VRALVWRAVLLLAAAGCCGAATGTRGQRTADWDRGLVRAGVGVGVGVGVLGRQKEAREAFFGACIVLYQWFSTVQYEGTGTKY